MAITTSSELFINMKDVPVYDKNKHYFDQSKDVRDFYQEERNKIVRGLNIGGFFIHPWLYWHINFFKTPVPIEENGVKIERVMVPPLDDNILYITDTYQQAEKENKGMCVFGTRGFAKSTDIASLCTHLVSTRENGSVMVIGGDSKDLGVISGFMETGLERINSAFYMPRLSTDWQGTVEFGVRKKSGTKHIFSRFDIRNADDKKEKSTEKGAGLNPVGFVADEIGKWNPIKILESAIPSFMTPMGAKLVHFLAGCVCAGTKVWTNSGKLVNIEDLNPSEGILGYDIDKFRVSQENITYWQPPHEKECYRIRTKSGRELECSYDHPIFHRNLKVNLYEKGTGKRKRFMGFTETHKLKKGDLIGVIESLPFTGEKRMWEPRLVGLLIGDGSYGPDKTPVLSTCDIEINNYIEERFDTTLEKTYQTKDGRTYKETRIRGIRHELKALGIIDQTKSDKRLPLGIHEYVEEDICEMVAGLFDSDGHVLSDGKNQAICFTSASKILMMEVIFVLQRLGVHGSLEFCKPRPTNPIQGGGWYRLTISDKRSFETFARKIKLYVTHKDERIQEGLEFLRNRRERISTEYSNVRFEKIVSIEPIGMKPVYNLTAGVTHTYVANGIVTHNTGGNTVLSNDAKTILQNPSDFELIMLNRDRLDRSVPEEALTWKDTKDKEFCTFVPGQMSYRLGILKKVTTLSKYLGKENKELDKIKIKVTDWVAATRLIEEKRSSLKKESSTNKHKMYYPLRTSDCFLVDAVNPFPTTVISNHIEKLEAEGRTGKNVMLYREGNSYKYEFSNKPRAKVSHDGGSVDSPTIIFDDPPEVTPQKLIFVGGHDGYKTDVSETDSLGSHYIIKRRNMAPNEPCERVVASYTTRPERMVDYLKGCETMMKAWNAVTNMESVDIGLQLHLEAKKIEYDYLCPAFSFTQKTSRTHAKLNSKFGLYPNTGNNTYRWNSLVAWAWEEHTVGLDNDNNPIIKYSVEFIEDVDLLREMLEWKKGNNVDRITAFSHALVYAQELDKDNVMPEREKKPQMSQEELEKRKELIKNSRYGNTSASRYGASGSSRY